MGHGAENDPLAIDALQSPSRRQPHQEIECDAPCGLEGKTASGIVEKGILSMLSSTKIDLPP